MKNTSVKSIKYWFVLNFGLLLISGSVYFFKVPNGFATGGVSSGVLKILCRKK